jgi:hypothetical protein
MKANFAIRLLRRIPPKLAAVLTLTHMLGLQQVAAQTFEPVCKGESEAFSDFIRGAGRFDRGFVPSGTLRFVQLSAHDGTLLRGFEAAATDVAGNPASSHGVILFVQGNAMLVDQLIRQARQMAKHGYDVVMYDFRGYGRSDGVATLKGITSDYDEILGNLAARKANPTLPNYGLFVYAISAGGMFVLDTDSLTVRADLIALDSVPANVNRRIQFLFWTWFDIECPDNVQPLARLPADMSHFFWYQGEKDNRVRFNDPNQMAVLEVARQRHATVVVDPDSKHILMDSQDSTDRRLGKALEFFDRYRLQEPGPANR